MRNGIHNLVRMHKSEGIYEILRNNADQDAMDWLNGKTATLVHSKSARALFMTYSQLASRFDKTSVTKYNGDSSDTSFYFKSHGADVLQLSRIYLLVKVLETDPVFYTPEVAKIIEVADTTELETFLRYLTILPESESFKHAAVEALRTNISIIFDAITLNNPYPALYFNDQQWNQMYLKAAFMERDLSMIESVDERANADLARIISDYAHERWAASRKIDPMFWRPVSKFMDDTLLSDMERLMTSEDPVENKAGALCCYFSEDKRALALLEKHQNLKEQIASNKITWNTLKK
ncbi:EboA domain-containing protein [Maribacter chungangensis]|uniref:EboA domain-containing protein n=1 Tax=Maribacter chungangensis TaxID=1069117 RepID=A0ABW3B1K0_9FLAO